MYTTPETYPVWRTAKPILVPRGVMHTYEYAVFNGGKIQKWEEIEARSVPATESEVVMEDEFGLSKAEQQAREKSFASGGFSSTNSIPRPPSEDDVDTLSALPSDVERMAQHYAQVAAEGSAPPGSRIREPMAGKALVLACFHLPVELKRNAATGGWTAQWNDSLIARSDSSIASSISTRWIGTVKPGRDRVLSEADKVSIRKALAPMDCFPIFAPQEVVDRAYLGFCKQQLWPSFHNVDMLDLTNACWAADVVVSNPELSWDQASQGDLWGAYNQLNEMFAKEVRLGEGEGA